MRHSHTHMLTLLQHPHTRMFAAMQHPHTHQSEPVTSLYMVAPMDTLATLIAMSSSARTRTSALLVTLWQ